MMTALAEAAARVPDLAGRFRFGRRRG
jgi:hypothetical protein